MTSTPMILGERPENAIIDCGCPLHSIYVRRSPLSPTLRFAHERTDPDAYSITPYHLARTLGIVVLGDRDIVASGAASKDLVARELAMDMHYSVISYLWALRYYGIDPVILEWSAGKRFRTNTRKIAGENVWNGPTYRPSYAMIGMALIGSGWTGFQAFGSEFRTIPEARRIPALRTTAAFYLQNPVDSFSQTNGFHALVERHGLHPVV